MAAPTENTTAVFLLWLLFFFVAVACVAMIGITYAAGDWYGAIAKPDWTPANDVFPKVWTVLYVLIAIAGCLVWTKRKTAVANVFWLAQLVVNGAWPILFFGMHRIDAGFLAILALFLLVLGFIWSAWRVSKLAALLFVPYLVWVGVAAALNGHMWVLNDMAMGVVAFPGTQ